MMTNFVNRAKTIVFAQASCYDNWVLCVRPYQNNSRNDNEREGALKALRSEMTSPDVVFYCFGGLYV